MPESLHHRLQERVKELTALHGAARLLQDPERPLDEVVPEVLALIPPAWQDPAVTAACLEWGDRRWQTPRYRETPWLQREEIRLRDGEAGSLTVVYLEPRPEADEGPFLHEERDLVGSLAELLRAHFQHRRDDAAIVAANERLERQVADRTAALRRLASEVCLAEERERRRIAADLHDNLGQALALMKLRLQRLRGDAVLGGHPGELSDLVSLCDQAVRYTRGLTFELSPPVLYELGLGPALEWLGEDLSRKHGLRVHARTRGNAPLSDDLKVMLWKSARELLHNVVKHAQARRVDVGLTIEPPAVMLEVIDDGRGFDLDEARRQSGERFGLFSIEERLRQFGGAVHVTTAPGEGTAVRLEAPTAGGRT
jgi:signal transduction histidine kinase